MIEICNAGADFVDRIILSGVEGRFVLTGRLTNKIVAIGYPKTHTQYYEKLNVSAGTIGDHYFIEGVLISKRYLEFLRGHFVLVLVQLYLGVEEPDVSKTNLW